jgi:hypothetical protein
MNSINSALKRFLELNTLLVSFIVNLFLFLSVLVFLTPTLGLDDVYVMLAASGFYTGEPSEFLLISNILLGKIFQWLYGTFPFVNWYGYLLTFLNFICMTLILYLFLKKSKSLISIVAFLIIFLVSGVEFYIRIHYTFIAFLCGFTGLFLLLFQPPNQKPLTRTLYYAGIFFLFIMAFLVRKESFYGIFAFSIIIIIYEFFKRRNFSLAIVIAVVVTIGFLLKFYDANYYNTKFDPNFSRYFEAQYVLNSENKIPQEITSDVLAKLNWTENDKALIDGWFWVDQNVFAQEKLIQYAGFVKRNKTFGETFHSLFQEIIVKPPSIKYFILLLLIFILSILKKETRTVLYLTLINAAVVCTLLVIFLNLNYRVLRPVWFFVIAINLLYIVTHIKQDEIINKKYRRNFLLVLIFMVGLVSLAVTKHQNDMNRQLRTSFNGAFEEINQHPNSIFVFRTIYEVYGFPVFVSPNHFSSKNVIISDWFTYSPVYFDILKYHNINGNLMKDLLLKDHFFIVNSNLFESVFIKFYSDHYNEDITVIKDNEFSSIEVLKLSKSNK